jgi:hypothetical protein
VTAPSSSGADAVRARAVRGLALAARSLEQSVGDLTLAQYRVLAFIAAGNVVDRDLITREAVEGDRRSLRLAVTPAGAAALQTAEHSMAERLDRVLEHARDPEALITALCDLDDAVAARMNARLQREVRT